MSEGIIAAVLALIGTMFGTFGGIVTSGKLTNYRLEQLEKKVDAHNNFALRIPLIEQKIAAVKEKTEKLEERGKIYENYKGDNSTHGYDTFSGA